MNIFDNFVNGGFDKKIIKDKRMDLKYSLLYVY